MQQHMIFVSGEFWTHSCYKSYFKSVCVFDIQTEKPYIMYTAISRKVVAKKVHATIPKGNMGYDHYTVPNDSSCRTCFFGFPLALANICPWPLLPFFQISLQRSELKTSDNTSRDCRVHFFRQPFSKQLYANRLIHYCQTTQ